MEPFNLYYINKIKEERKENYIQVISIDPAIKNFALRVERRYDSGLIKCILFDKLDLSDPNPNLIYKNLIDKLDCYNKIFLDCHIIIIEKQFPNSINSIIRITQHTITYFMITLKDSKLNPYIYELSPKLKSKILNAPNKLKYKELKNWSINKAIELLELRKDNFSLNIINKNKKKDDFADTVCQIEALFIYLKLLPTKLIINNMIINNNN